MATLFSPFSLKKMELKNRVVLPPMCTYSAKGPGMVKNWHKIHYGARAAGGTGLIIQEATAVEKRGRLSSADLGIWSSEHTEGLQELVEIIHSLGSVVAVQLGHGGNKANPGNQTKIGPSQERTSNGTSKEMTVEQIQEVVNSFAQAAKRAVAVGYDAVEIHGAHGFLLHQFLSPLFNFRRDEYGDSMEGRLKFPLQVIKAVKKQIPQGMPLILRISAVEHREDGYSFTEMLKMARRFCDAGVDILDVSTGGAGVIPKTYPGYQLVYGEKVRRELNVPVIACGQVSSPELAQEWVANDRVDLVAIGRAQLRDPYWVIKASQDLGEPGWIPEPYKAAFPRHLWYGD